MKKIFAAALIILSVSSSFAQSKYFKSTDNLLKSTRASMGKLHSMQYENYILDLFDSAYSDILTGDFLISSQKEEKSGMHKAGLEKLNEGLPKLYDIIVALESSKYSSEYEYYHDFSNIPEDEDAKKLNNRVIQISKEISNIKVVIKKVNKYMSVKSNN